MTVVHCLWTDSFACILEKYSEAVEKVVISTNEKFVDPCHIVPMSTPVSILLVTVAARQLRRQSP